MTNKMMFVDVFVWQLFLQTFPFKEWHKTNLVKDWAIANPSVKLEYLPKYAPEVNPIERHWWFLRKTTTQNVLFETAEQCWEAVKNHFANLTSDQIVRLCQI
jgi:transposase